MSSSPSTRPMSRSPARDGLLQSTVPHPRRANSSAAGLRSGSEACCSHFLGSCRELTVHDFFCKTQIWKVSSQLHVKRAEVWGDMLADFEPKCLSSAERPAAC